MSEIKLLNCPFCGGEAKIIEDNTIENRPQYQIRCKNISCTIRPKTNWHIDKSEAIRHWNTRKPMERILTRLEDIKKVNPLGRIGHPKVVTSETIRVTDKAIEIYKEEGGIE